MSERRSHVDEERFIYVADAGAPDKRQFIALHWCGTDFTPNDAFLGPLRSYVQPRAELTEVWFVYPADLTTTYDQLRALERLPDSQSGPDIHYRYFAVTAEGELSEQGEIRADGRIQLTPTVTREVLLEGARQLFSDSDGLACATAGFHFAHPGGSHSQYFMRGGQAAARVQHAHFLALLLLRHLAASVDTATVWVDSASIAPVGYAFADLARRLGRTPPTRIESFSGYDGLDTQLRPKPTDVVLISSSTSGSMGDKVHRTKKLSADRVVTLFYLNTQEWKEDHGTLVCDLTDRDLVAARADRESRLRPYDTYESEHCDLCRQGSGEIRLAGDSFFPETGVIALRMPTFKDRPLDGKRDRSDDDLVKFDGSDYFSDLFGCGAITYDPASGPLQRDRGVSTRLGSLFPLANESSLDTRLREKLAEAVPDPADVSVVLSLLDEDSRLVGEHCATLMFGAQPNGKPGRHWHQWTRSDTVTLAELPEGSTILVCAGVVASGRLLTSISRELRKVSQSFRTRYFVVVAHPESSSAWATHVNTLSRKSSQDDSTDDSTVTHVWRLPREPASPGGGTPWTRERRVLRSIAEWLGQHEQYRSLLRALEPRLGQLGQLHDNNLLVAATAPTATDPMPPINRNFALWPFEWSEHERYVASGIPPTHAEVFATIAHLLYESRRLSQTVEPRISAVRRHGYALNPAVFDRFNDPAIQAAILRGTTAGELNYAPDADASRAVVDLLWFVLTNLDSESGAAGYEFLLSLSEGTSLRDGFGLRVGHRQLAHLLSDLEREYGSDFEGLTAISPPVRALLLYVRGRLAHDGS